jgi:cytoskeleton protein RodZ
MDSFGARLQHERKQRGLTLEEVSLSTKIHIRFLTAIEQEDFDQLPGGIFNKGFVRAYARCIGSDEEQAVLDYLAASRVVESTLNDPEQPETLQRPKKSYAPNRVLWAVFVASLVVITVGFVIVGRYQREAATGNLTSVSPPGQSLPPSNEVSDPAGTLVEHHTPVAKNESPTSVAPETSTQPGTERVSETKVRMSGEPCTPGEFCVLVEAREDAWLSVTADGKQIKRDILAAPAEELVQARNRITIRAGNIGALDFSFNGHKLPSQGDYDEAKTLSFGADGLEKQAAQSSPMLTSVDR